MRPWCSAPEASREPPSIPSIFAILAAFAAAAVAAPARPSPAEAFAATLRIDKAGYDLGSGVLSFTFTCANAGDSALYLEYQVPPRASLDGNTLTLVFDRRSSAAEGAPAGGDEDTAGGDSLSGVHSGEDSGADSGNDRGDHRVDDHGYDPEAYPPQRVASRHTFQAQRRMDRVLGNSGKREDRPRFTALRLIMAAFPERTEGEGDPFLAERGRQIVSAPHSVKRTGKPPGPPKVFRYRKPDP